MAQQQGFPRYDPPQIQLNFQGQAANQVPSRPTTTQPVQQAYPYHQPNTPVAFSAPRPLNQASLQAPKRPKSSPKSLFFLALIIGIVVVIGASIGGYLYYRNNLNAQATNVSSRSQISSTMSSATSASTISSTQNTSATTSAISSNTTKSSTSTSNLPIYTGTTYTLAYPTSFASIKLDSYDVAYQNSSKSVLLAAKIEKNPLGTQESCNAYALELMKQSNRSNILSSFQAQDTEYRCQVTYTAEQDGVKTAYDYVILTDIATTKSVGALVASLSSANQSEVEAAKQAQTQFALIH